jgi:hypothetical protein
MPASSAKGFTTTAKPAAAMCNRLQHEAQRRACRHAARLKPDAWRGFTGSRPGGPGEYWKVRMMPCRVTSPSPLPLPPAVVGDSRGEPFPWGDPNGPPERCWFLRNRNGRSSVGVRIAGPTPVSLFAAPRRMPAFIARAAIQTVNRTFGSGVEAYSFPRPALRRNHGSPSSKFGDCEWLHSAAPFSGIYLLKNRSGYGEHEKFESFRMNSLEFRCQLHNH